VRAAPPRRAATDQAASDLRHFRGQITIIKDSALPHLSLCRSDTTIIVLLSRNNALLFARANRPMGERTSQAYRPRLGDAGPRRTINEPIHALHRTPALDTDLRAPENRPGAARFRADADRLQTARSPPGPPDETSIRCDSALNVLCSGSLKQFEAL
jgi:hypothetical protein